MEVERSAPSRQRRLSVVSFISNDRAPLRVEPKFGRKLGVVSDPRVFSAGSNISSASTWSLGRNPAASIIALRSRIMITIDKSLDLIDDFDHTFLHEVDEDFAGIYQEFVRQLLARIGYKTDLLNCDQLDSVIMKRFKDEAAVAKRADFRSLEIVCARSKSFRELCTQVRMRLDEVHEYANTFCVTFSDENEGLSFESLENYENTKTDCLKEIHINMDAIKASLEDFREIAPLSMYLDQYARVMHYIEHIVRCLRCVATNLKRWVVADEQYEKALEKELCYLKQKSAKMSADRLAVSNLRYEVRARAPTASGRLRKTELNFSRSKSVLKTLRLKQQNIDRLVNENREKQQKLRQEINRIERLSGRKQTSRSFNSLTPDVDMLRFNLEGLEAQGDVLIAHQTDNKHEIVSVTKEMHELESDMSKRHRCLDKTTERVHEHSALLHQHEQLSNNVGHKIHVLRKLQSLKKNPDTLRKMEFNMINIDYKEAMQTAIRAVALRVGSSWPDIYVNLPFMPMRDERTRRADIEAMKKTQITSDKTDVEQAIIAFEKWAKRSTSATVNELIYASKHLIDRSVRREISRKSKFSVPRSKKRFQNLKAKTNVIYV